MFGRFIWWLATYIYRKEFNRNIKVVFKLFDSMEPDFEYRQKVWKLKESMERGGKLNRDGYFGWFVKEFHKTTLHRVYGYRLSRTSVLLAGHPSHILISMVSTRKGFTPLTVIVHVYDLENIIKAYTNDMNGLFDNSDFYFNEYLDRNVPIAKALINKLDVVLDKQMKKDS